MTLSCYAGLPGAGKSYGVVENVIVAALKERRYVVHNLMLSEAALQIVCDPKDGKPYDVTKYLIQVPKDFDGFEGWPEFGKNPEDLETRQREFKCDKLIEICRPGAVLVIDEVWEFWPQGLKANEIPKRHLEFFKKHRHRVDEETGHATDIYIIDQDPASGIPAFLRSLVDLTYLHAKLDKVGAKGKFRVDIYSRCQSAERPKKSAFLRSMFGTYKPTVWNCYISHTESKKPYEGGLEKAPDNRGSIWKSYKIRMAIVAAALLPFAIAFAISSVKGLADPSKVRVNSTGTAPATKGSGAAPVLPDQSIVPSSAAPVPVAMVPVVAPGAPVATKPAGDRGAVPPVDAVVPDPLQVSTTWRLVGVIRGGAKQTALLSSSTGRRYVDAAICEEFEREFRCKVEDGFAYFFSGGQRLFTAAKPEASTTNAPR